MNSNLNTQNLNTKTQQQKIEELQLIKKTIREYRKERREAKATIAQLAQVINELEISLMKTWDEKLKARLRCKKATALARLDTAQARKNRLTRYINESKWKQISLKGSGEK